MTRFGWLVLTGVLVAVLGVALLLWGFSKQSEELGSETATTTPMLDPNTVAIYTSGTHGFSFMYPASAMLDESLEGESWRANTSATGTPIARVEAGTGEVRVGVSEEASAVAACEEAGPSEREGVAYATETAVWSVFTFEELGTDNERRVTSYRRVAGDRCIAVEVFEPLVAPTEQPADLRLVIRSFTFAE